jgi:hypothetical protein
MFVSKLGVHHKVDAIKKGVYYTIETDLKSEMNAGFG